MSIINWLIAAFQSLFFWTKPEPTVITAIPSLIQSIPGSMYHQPQGTWWGYNQKKVARRGDRVFMYVMENAGGKT